MEEALGGWFEAISIRILSQTFQLVGEQRARRNMSEKLTEMSSVAKSPRPAPGTVFDVSPGVCAAHLTIALTWNVFPFDLEISAFPSMLVLQPCEQVLPAPFEVAHCRGRWTVQNMPQSKGRSHFLSYKLKESLVFTKLTDFPVARDGTRQESISYGLYRKSLLSTSIAI
jgi:hypothetical protein